MQLQPFANPGLPSIAARQTRDLCHLQQKASHLLLLVVATVLAGQHTSYARQFE